jgi:hypothetical protein
MRDDDAKRSILKRRARFVAAALASAGLAATTGGCGGKTEREGQPEDAGADVSLPQPCLTPEASPQPCLTSVQDAEPQPCLGMPEPDAADDASPEPCLDVPFDAGTD